MEEFSKIQRERMIKLVYGDWNNRIFRKYTKKKF
jgi:hypothetical protein